MKDKSAHSVYSKMKRM